MARPSTIQFSKGTFITSLPAPPTPDLTLPAKGEIKKLTFKVQNLKSVIEYDTYAKKDPEATPTDYPPFNLARKQGTYTKADVNKTLSLTPLGTPAYKTDSATPSVSATAASAPPVAIPSLAFFADPDNAGLSELEAPTLEIAQRASLTPIELLTYTAAEIAPFTPDLPAYTPYSPALLSPPEQLTYEDDTQLITDIQQAAGESISQDALYEAATPYLDLDEMFESQKVFAQAGARGFSAPTGVVNAGLAEVAEKYERQRRDVRQKVLEETEARLRKRAVAAANALIDLEGKHASLLYTYAAKTIETSRINLQIATELINNDIEAYNAQVRAVNTVVAAYRAYTRAVAEQDEAVVAQLSARRAAARTHKADVDMYNAQIDLYTAAVDVSKLSVDQQTLVFEEYEELVRAYQQNLQIARAHIDAAEESVRAVAQKTEADVALVSSYAKQAESEASRVAVYNANIDAYTATVRGNSAQQQAYVRYVNESISTFSAELDKYREYINAQRAYLQTYAAESQGKLDVVKSWARGQASETQIQSANYASELEHKVADVNKDLLDKEYNSRKDLIDAQKYAEDARIKAGLEAAKASAAAGLAQAAYATLNVSARITDEGTFTDDVSGSERVSYSQSGRRSWVKTTTHEGTV